MPVGPADGVLAARAAELSRPDAIRKTARELEGMFLGEVMRILRETAPAESFGGGGLAGDVFVGMLDGELAGRAGGAGGLGLADLIERQLGGASGPAIRPAAVLAAYRAERAPPPVPPAPTADESWVHPLATGRLPRGAGGRFGAARPAERVHKGADLAAPEGTPVRATGDGVVERIERDADRGGRAGRYVRIAHAGGVVTRYVHMDAVRDDLRSGDRVRAGEAIGTVGRTGVERSATHLHFSVSLRPADGGSETYIDPEPWLRAWSEGRPAHPAKALSVSVEGTKEDHREGP